MKHHIQSPFLWLLGFLLIFSHDPVQAQSLPVRGGQVEFGAGVNLSDPLRIQRQYDAGPGETDISSSRSPGFEFRLGYAKRLSKNIRWMAGIVYGADSYHIDLYVTDEFNQLGWGGYADSYTQFEMRYSSLLAGARVDFPIRSNDFLFLQPALRITYPWRSYSELASYAVTGNGRVRQLFLAEMINNGGNNLIFSPEIGLFYQLNFGSGRLGLITGVNAAYSNQYPFSGEYRIFGDNDILEGALEKRFLHIGAMLAIYWKLDGIMGDPTDRQRPTD